MKSKKTTSIKLKNLKISKLLGIGQAFTPELEKIGPNPYSHIARR